MGFRGVDAGFPIGRASPLDLPGVRLVPAVQGRSNPGPLPSVHGKRGPLTGSPGPAARQPGGRLLGTISEGGSVPCHSPCCCPARRSARPFRVARRDRLAQGKGSARKPAVHRLPASLTSFVGRGVELAELRQLPRSGRIRISPISRARWLSHAARCSCGAPRQIGSSPCPRPC